MEFDIEKLVDGIEFLLAYDAAQSNSNQPGNNGIPWTELNKLLWASRIFDKQDMLQFLHNSYAPTHTERKDYLRTVCLLILAAYDSDSL